MQIDKMTIIKNEVFGDVAQKVASANNIVQEQQKFEVNNKIAKQELFEALNKEYNFENLDSLSVELNYTVNKKTNDIQIAIIDPKTKEVIRNKPTEAIVKIRTRMNEILGAFIDERF